MCFVLFLETPYVIIGEIWLYKTTACQKTLIVVICFVDVSPPDRSFGFGTGVSSLAGDAIAEEAMDTSTVSQPMTVCGPGAQTHSMGIRSNFHMDRWDNDERSDSRQEIQFHQCFAILGIMPIKKSAACSQTISGLLIIIVNSNLCDYWDSMW